MARYHMIVNSGTIPVYRRSDCSGPCGELYPGEVFVNLGVTTGYLNVKMCIRDRCRGHNTPKHN